MKTTDPKPIQASEAILRARKGEKCPEVTGYQHMPLPENAWLVRGNRGPLLICANSASSAISAYEE